MGLFSKDATKDGEDKAEDEPIRSTSTMKIIVNLFYEPVDELKKILMEHRDVLFPILGGAARPDMFVSKWVRDNVQFDSTGENISVHNKVVNEMTSIYWAWKHYREMGDPDYVGFNHYRRFFRLSDLEDRDAYDIVCAERTMCRTTVYGDYSVYHRIDDLKRAMEIVKAESPVFYRDFNNAVCGTGIFTCNMFLMKRDMFFLYCETLFPLISRIAASIDLNGRDNYQKRAVCFIAERMTSAWIEGQALNNGKRIKQVPIDFRPEFKDNHLNERGTFG